MKKINLKYQIAAGEILVICGTLVLLSDYIKDKRDVVFSEMNLALSSMNMDDSLNNQDENIDNVEENKGENPNYTYEEYLGIIDISKINLYKGFYNKDSNLNNVKFNLYVLPESNYPDIKGGNLIIAGHSGNYNNSYFANLYMLEVNDDIVIPDKISNITIVITNAISVIPFVFLFFKVLVCVCLYTLSMLSAFFIFLIIPFFQGTKFD